MHYLIRLAALAVVVEICCVVHFRTFTPAWINCYLAGMIFRKGIILQGRIRKYIIMGIYFIMILLNGIQITLDNMGIAFQGIYLRVYHQMCNYAHVFLAMGIFIGVLILFSGKDIPNKVKDVLNVSDKYSYDIFLVHPVLVWSGISPLRNFDSPIIACMVLLVEILVAARILNWGAHLIRRMF